MIVEKMADYFLKRFEGTSPTTAKKSGDNKTPGTKPPHKTPKTDPPTPPTTGGGP